MTMTATRQAGRPAGTAATDAVMRAIVQDAYGSAEVLRLADIGTPGIAANEVLVRVRAAGMDRGTWHLMAGQPYLLRLIFGFRRPRQRVAGRDLAGTVVAVGGKVTSLRVGDQVFGVGRGSFAEYAAAREDRLAHKPAGLGFAPAAVVAISGMTSRRCATSAASNRGSRC
jgi:NADPH:quinone reductase-like Zn-dependent oxidoreductase